MIEIAHGRRSHMQRVLDDANFELPREMGPARCRVQILRENDRTIVLLTQRIGSTDGRSLTNAAEDFAQTLRDIYFPDASRLPSFISRYVRDGAPEEWLEETDDWIQLTTVFDAKGRVDWTGIDAEDRQMLHLFALRSATVQQVQVDYLDAHARLAELEAAKARESSITLQHSLLTPPPEPNHLHLVVRYQPAAQDLEIGGDWYDAFLTKDGATTLVIGDVTGHDHHAAAAMGQLRGLIRAIAFDSGQPPARVLERTDEAIRGLNLGSAATATAIVARIEQSRADRLEGIRAVRWSNAGHLHPILIRANGSIEVLNRKNDLLLGILPDVERTEHELELNPLDTLFFYTDGLIERRHTPLSQSIAALVEALQDAHTRTLDELADHVLATLAPGEADDDVALVIVRPYPEDEPRPAEAGPTRNIPSSLEDPADSTH